jgi:hypothetical protein
MKWICFLTFYLLISLARVNGQGSPTDPSMAYLFTLQRAKAKQPLDALNQKDRFCAELKKIQSAVKLPPALEQKFAAEPLCDKLLAETASSPYERADFVWLRRILETRVRTALKVLGVDLPGEPVIGTLPVPLLNAKAIQVPGGKRPLIVLNDSVFRLPYEMSRASLEVLAFETATGGPTTISVDQKKIAAWLSLHPELKVRFEAAVLDYLHLPVDSTAYTPPTTLDTNLGVLREKLLVGLTESMETFVICHEFAHIILHHEVGGTATLALGPTEPLSNVHEAWYSWRQEFAADAYGFALLDEVLKEQASGRSGSYLKDPLYPFFLYGPRFFFASMSVVENADALIRSGIPAPSPSAEDARIAERALSSNVESKNAGKTVEDAAKATASHPPFQLRYKEMETVERRALSSFLEKAELKPGTEETYRFSKAFGNALGVLFEQSIPDFKKRYESRN